MSAKCEVRSAKYEAAPLWRRLLRWFSPRFDQYRPAPRLGTRQVEQRLLRRLGNPALETTI